MSSSSLCDRCGAMLPLPDLDGNTSCLSCGRTVNVASVVEPLVGDGWRRGGVEAPPSSSWSAGVRERAATRSAARVAKQGRPGRVRRMIVTSTVTSLLLAVGVATFANRSDNRSDQSSSASYLLEAGSTRILSSEGAATDVLAVMHDQDARQYVVVRTSYTAENTGGGEVIWASDPLPSKGREASYAVDGDDLYLVTGSSVWKLDLASGRRQWQSELPDLVPPTCPDCFSVIDDLLVVQTIDGQVMALAPETGEEQWRRRFDDAEGSVVVAHGRLLVVDRSPEIDAATVYRLDPATGKEESGRTLRCEGDDSLLDSVGSASTPVFTVPESTDVVAFFGYGCILRWDVETAEVRWERPWEFGPQIFGPPAVLSASHLVISTAPEDSVVVDLDDGDIRPLEGIADQAMTPWMIEGNTILAGIESRRGTTKAGLAAWNAETGKRAWVETSGRPSSLIDQTFSPPSATMATGEPVWIVLKPDPRQADAAPTVVEFDGDTQTATIRTIDPASGATVRSMDLGYRYLREPNPAGWLSLEDQRDGVLVVELEYLPQVIDLESGDLLGWRGWRPN